ncbi:MAG: hypothetical protein M9890_13410 [Thermomicrobiales bacterium]|nr:hypothetical protein [Thermomicrobiales bacterium]
MILPIYHAGKFSWDEALVLVLVMAAVPLIAWYRGRNESDDTPDVPTPPPSQSSAPDDSAA